MVTAGSSQSFGLSGGSGLVMKGAPAPTRPLADAAMRLKSLIRRSALNLSLLEGCVEGGEFRTLVADDGSALPYFGSVIYPSDYTEKPIGRISSLCASKLSKSDADLVVIGANLWLLPLYRGKGYFIIPKFVRVFLPVSGHPDTMIGRLPSSAREDIRRNVRRMLERGFHYEVLGDDASFDRFYHEMYVPYVEQRHGKLARTHDYRHIKSYFSKGFILLIKRGDTAVAGTISYTWRRTLCNTYMGVAGGDHGEAREGASTALYYYSLMFAHSSGCEGVDFGNSRPFMTDGSLRYKLKWGARVADIDDGIGVYAVAAPGCSPQAAAFLSRNRFFQLTKKGIRLCDDLQAECDQ